MDHSKKSSKKKRRRLHTTIQMEWLMANIVTPQDLFKFYCCLEKNLPNEQRINIRRIRMNRQNCKHKSSRILKHLNLKQGQGKAIKYSKTGIVVQIQMVLTINKDHHMNKEEDQHLRKEQIHMLEIIGGVNQDLHRQCQEEDR